MVESALEHCALLDELGFTRYVRVASRTPTRAR